MRLIDADEILKKMQRGKLLVYPKGCNRGRSHNRRRDSKAWGMEILPLQRYQQCLCGGLRMFSL